MNSTGHSGAVGQGGQAGMQASCGQASTDATRQGLAQTILNHEKSQAWVDQNSDPKTGGLSGSVTQISNGIAKLVATIVTQGTRLSAEQLLSTGLMLNGSICRAFLAVVQNSLQREKADLPSDGTGNIHRLESACASVRSVLQCVHELEQGTRNGLSNAEDVFGEHVSSASLWLSIPEASGLLLVAVCEILSHGVESGALSAGALSEFEPFCREACAIIGRCSQEGASQWRASHKEMHDMMTEQCGSQADKLLPRAASGATHAPDKSRQATHGTMAVSLFSAPVLSSKLVLLTELKSFEGSTHASQRCSVLSKEVAREESQAGVPGWPETGSTGRLSSFFNSMRQLLKRLHDEGIDLEGNKASMASSAFSTSQVAVSLSLMLSELITLRSVIARLSQAPQTSQDSRGFSKHTSGGINSKQTLSQEKSKDGSFQTDRTAVQSKDGLDQAQLHTQHKGPKSDASLFSQASELPVMGRTVTLASHTTLKSAEGTQSSGNSTTQSLYKSSALTHTAPKHLTTDPLQELTGIVKQVSQDQQHPQYSRVCNSLSKLSRQFEAVQAALVKRSSDAGSTKSTYSGTLLVSMEPTALSSLSVQTLSQLCKHFAQIRESLVHCCHELRAETGRQTQETGARTDSKQSVFSNTIETASQSLANTTEVTQQELREGRGRSEQLEVLQHEQSLSAVETALSKASSEVSKVLILLTANSGNTGRQLVRKKFEANISTMQSEASSNQGLSETTQAPEERLCDNDCSGGTGALSNTVTFGTLGVSGTLLKLFETVHSLGSALSETLLQSLIFATHPIEQSMAAIEAWKDRPWVRESHPIEGQSRSISTAQQSRITADVATMVRNILCVFCISSGSSQRQEIVVVPAPEALRRIVAGFGTREEAPEELSIHAVLDEMRELSLNREQTLYRELTKMLESRLGRGALEAQHVTQLSDTRAWIVELLRREDKRVNKTPQFASLLRDYVLHMIHMVQGRRWSGTGVQRKLSPREVQFLLDELLKPAPVIEQAPLPEDVERIDIDEHLEREHRRKEEDADMVEIDIN